MKKRIFFDKFNEMRFISHLDMLRFMDRILKKAHIEMKYSQGFHPRPKISLGNPVSLGTEAFNEVMDIEILNEMSNDELRERLNSISVDGFRVNKVEDVFDKISIVDVYKNAIFELESEKNIIDTLEQFFLQDEIIERKEKNGKVVERNLGERVLNFKREGNKIILELINTSPNSFLILAGIKVSDVKIVKKGYKI